MFKDYKSLRKSQVVALSLWAIVFLAGSVWKLVRAEQWKRTEKLYFAARAGDKFSMTALGRDNSEYANDFLVHIAQDPNTWTDIRQDALRIIAERPNLDSAPLAAIMGPNQPFAIRHQISDIFSKRGCDDTCISAALYGLWSLERGTPTVEMTLTAPPAAEVARSKILSDLRDATVADYKGLLDINPCASRRVLGTDYPTDGEFARSISTELKSCK